MNGGLANVQYTTFFFLLHCEIDYISVSYGHAECRTLLFVYRIHNSTLYKEASGGAILKECDWKPDEQRKPLDRAIHIRVSASEGEVHHRARGIWHPRFQVWELRSDQVSTFGLAGRILREESKMYGLHRSRGG